MFAVHSRGVFTQDKSGYFSNSKVYGKMEPGKSVHYEGVFTNLELYSIMIHSKFQSILPKNGQENGTET